MYMYLFKDCIKDIVVKLLLYEFGHDEYPAVGVANFYSLIPCIVYALCMTIGELVYVLLPSIYM